MSFAWPFALLFVLVVPAVLGIYLLLLRRRRPAAVSYSSLALLRSVMPRRTSWLRHLPIGLVLVSLALLAVAAARPEITSEVALSRSTVVLALDESGSMCSTDVVPNRITAAQTAARQFIDSLPTGTLAGLVEFNGFAEIAVPPTTNHGPLVKALDNLSVGPGTAIGAAMLEALDAIAQVDPKVQPIGNAVSSSALNPAGSDNSSTANSLPSRTPKPGSHGYVPDVIVLLTDGANNRGITPLQAVPYAVSRGVRVYTIGFGTTDPGPLRCTVQEMSGELSTGGFGGGGGYGGGYSGGGGYGPGYTGGNPLIVDLPPLQEVSRATGGVSYRAQDESQLAKVFANLPKQIAEQKERQEITWLFAALGALLALIAAAASMRWSPYP